MAKTLFAFEMSSCLCFVFIFFGGFLTWWDFGVLLLQVFAGIFRCYAVVIALFVAVAETEWGFIIKFWRVSFVVKFAII